MCNFSFLGHDDLTVKAVQRGDRLDVRIITSEGFPFATVSVDVPDESLSDEVAALLEGECFTVKNYSENAGLFEALIKFGVIEDTGFRVSSGYIDIPVARFAQQGLPN